MTLFVFYLGKSAINRLIKLILCYFTFIFITSAGYLLLSSYNINLLKGNDCSKCLCVCSISNTT